MSRVRTVVPVVLAASIALGVAPTVASAKTQSVVPLARTVAVGADRGESPWVRLYDGMTGKQRSSFLAYPADFRGGVRIARGDVDGDGVADIITGPGPGAGPHVKVFSGADGHLMRSFLAFTASFANGVHVAAGDVNADGRADVIVGADAGGPPHVKVFDGATGALRSSFYAYGATFTGGVRVAAGDVDGDTRADVIAGTGPGAGGQVKVFSGASGALIRSFLPYGPSFTAGVYVAAGRVDGDAPADIITGTGAGVAHLKAFSGTTGAVLMSFLPYGPSSIGGVRVAAGQVDRDARADVIAAGGPHITVFSGADASTLSSFLTGGPGSGAVFVAG